MEAGWLDGIVDRVVQIGRARAEKLERAKLAVQRGDDSQAIEILRDLFGIERPTEIASN